MICRVGEQTVAGRAVDLRVCDAVGSDAGDAASPDPETVVTAVRAGTATTCDGTRLAVVAREPGRLHRRVGCITPGRSLRPRTALAIAARSRGWATPVDDDLAGARERLQAHPEARTEGSEVAGTDDVRAAHSDARAARSDARAARSDARTDRPDALTARRRELAEVTEDVDRLREHAAAARGRIQAEDAGERTGTDRRGETPLADAIRELSEAETAAAAAREHHRRGLDAARARRDRLQQRLHLEDEVANLEREARAHLVERARGAYESALAAVPGRADGRPPSDAGTPPTDPFSADPDAMALAVARVGELKAPAVVACDRFPDAATAARWLGAPVVRL